MISFIDTKLKNLSTKVIILKLFPSETSLRQLFVAFLFFRGYIVRLEKTEWRKNNFIEIRGAREHNLKKH